MENPIIGIAVKFQYNIPTLRTLVVMDTISWSSGSTRWSAQKELYFPTKILNTAPICENGAENRSVEC